MALMSHGSFMSRLLKPTYVYRMALGKDRGGDSPYERGARTTLAKVQREIDDLVLQRALAIQDERRCAAISRGDSPVRCEFQRGHGPVGPGIADTRLSHVTARSDWDHGAPRKGTWWKTNQIHEMETT